MAYAFRVTAKHWRENRQRHECTVCGTSFYPAQIKTILNAFKTQLGLEVKGVSVTTGLFTIEKL